MVTRGLHPRHCTERVEVAAYSPSATGFAGTWSPVPGTWLAQVESRRELAISPDGVAVHTVLSIRVPPAPVLAGDTDPVHDDPPGARGLIDLFPVESRVNYRGRISYVLAVREVLRMGQLVYLEVTTGDRPPLFGGWLVTDAVLERRPGVDRRGNPVPGEDVPLPEAVLRPDSSTESDEVQQPETDAEMFLPPGAPDVSSTDRVRVPSSPMAGYYQVVGNPAPTPTRTLVQLRRL